MGRVADSPAVAVIAPTEGDVEERVAALETRLDEFESTVRTAVNRDSPLMKGTVRAITDADIESIEEVPETGRRVRKQVAGHAERLAAVAGQLATLGEISGDAATNAETFAAVLAFAANTRNGSTKVAVSPAETKGYTGVSRRYAYELLDAMGEESNERESAPRPIEFDWASRRLGRNPPGCTRGCGP